MVYLDNSATTRVSEKAAKKALYMMTECFANPSSLYDFGFKAELELKEAKRIISSSIGCREGELYFTSGGTESNNTAILGVANANKRRGNKIVVSSYEHSSVMDSVKHLSENGFEIVFVKPDKDGKIKSSDVAAAVDEKTILVSVMLVNNEIGAINDIATISAAARRKNNKVIVHCDAVQGFGKIPVNVGKLSADLLSITAHKIGGPKGVGALFVKKGTKISPIIFGGEQQNRFRPGTENCAGIAAFSVAVDETIGFMAQTYSKVKELKNYLVEKLCEIDGIVINSGEDSLSYIVNFSTMCIKSETLMHFLEKKEIYVSSGSACAKGKKSHVLSALSLSDLAIDTAIRVSFSKDNTKQDIDALIEALKEGISTLQKLK